ncbi:GNAT family N-acetyltransferase [Micromonospora sp. WMMD882]|uniref:GNAT family N-acetyltransferase n=1 Tax=Micromonospora sp. WMMD882 TaxID=3015151 RepID=UPI00248C96CC|nr:GNAT family N-acetyltransferase [Micromonospora sp. WMMD882]WBB78951.1 GNAT family N-acetyltransferase [Micromonospora sp. WMMD882]
MSIVIASFDESDQAAIDAAYAVSGAAKAVDLPDFPHAREAFEATLRHPMPGRSQHLALATLDGTPAGYLELRMSVLENLDNAGVELLVHPARRRRGVGRALHEYAVQVLRGQGRKRLIGPTVGPLPDGPDRPDNGSGFAAAMGAKPALPEVRRRLEIPTLDHPALDALLADARGRAAGYRTVGWQGATPAEYLDDIAYLDSRLLEDAPIGDLTMEPDKVDAERVRGVDRVLAVRGRRAYHQGVLHVASGRLVAWTMIDVHRATSWHAFQQITIVDPAHRGRRLGLLCKIENLRYVLAHEPQLRVIDTFNAASNSYMIAVNEQMGFRPVDAWMEWQLDF